MLKRFVKYGFFSCFVMICYQLSAKTIDTTLSELVKESGLIAYGHPASSSQPALEKSDTHVLFKTITVFKGVVTSKENVISLCKMPASSESYDLEAIKGNYIVFGSIEGKCYRPVHWVSSIIKVENDIALTSEVSDQPSEQPMAKFFKKIEAAVKKYKSLNK